MHTHAHFSSTRSFGLFSLTAQSKIYFLQKNVFFSISFKNWHSSCLYQECNNSTMKGIFRKCSADLLPNIVSNG